MTKTFKAGDRVRCIQTHGTSQASRKAFGAVGDLGTVTSFTNGAVYVKLDGADRERGMTPTRFELVKTPIKAGDRVKCVSGTPGLSRYGAFGDLATVNKTGGNGTILNVTFDKDKRTVNVNVERFEKIGEAPKVEPKPVFKVGDRVRITGAHPGWFFKNGTLGTITLKNSYGSWDVKLDGHHMHGALRDGEMELVTAATPEPAKPDLKTALGGDFTTPYRVSKPIQKRWIIAVLGNDGTPRPAEKPALYTSEAQAHAVAKSMAEKHTGETFMVFESTAVAAQPKTVSVELVRL